MSHFFKSLEKNYAHPLRSNFAWKASHSQRVRCACTCWLCQTPCLSNTHTHTHTHTQQWMEVLITSIQGRSRHVRVSMYVIYTHSRAYTYKHIHVNIDTCIHTMRPYTLRYIYMHAYNQTLYHKPKLNKVEIHGYGFTCACVCACVSAGSACVCVCECVQRMPGRCREQISGAFAEEDKTWLFISMYTSLVTSHEWDVTWLIYVHFLCACVGYINGPPHSYVWHDSFICVTWLIHMCDMTHSYVHFLCACVG